MQKISFTGAQIRTFNFSNNVSCYKKSKKVINVLNNLKSRLGNDYTIKRMKNSTCERFMSNPDIYVTEYIIIKDKITKARALIFSDAIKPETKIRITNFDNLDYFVNNELDKLNSTRDKEILTSTKHKLNHKITSHEELMESFDKLLQPFLKK